MSAGVQLSPESGPVPRRGFLATKRGHLIVIGVCLLSLAVTAYKKTGRATPGTVPLVLEDIYLVDSSGGAPPLDGDMRTSIHSVAVAGASGLTLRSNPPPESKEKPCPDDLTDVSIMRPTDTETAATPFVDNVTWKSSCGLRVTS